MMPRFVSAIAALVLLVAGALSAKTLRPGSHEGTLSHGGRQRTYLLHLPPAIRAGRPLPLVMGLHGGGGSARTFARKTGFSALADREGFIAVFPNGTNRFSKTRLLTWNAGHGCGFARRAGIDDVGFLRALVDELCRELPVDRRRIFVTGHSNGAFMAYRLGAELSDRIAAIAPVAGAIGGQANWLADPYVIPRPAHPVSVIIFHGMKDESVRFAGGRTGGVERRRRDLSVGEAVRFWVGANGCRKKPAEEKLAGGAVLNRTWSGGKGGTEVVLYAAVEGGHGWPGDPTWRRWNRNPTMEISATSLIWAFFKAHPRGSV